VGHARNANPWDGIVTVTGLAARTGPDEIGRMKLPPNPDYRHRFPAEIISHAVWLYHVFSLSLRDVELILAERGIAISYETIRRWCRKFGGGFANCLRRRRPHPGDKRHLDEVFGSKACSIISSELLISMVLRWTSSFRNGAMRKPPSASSKGCSRDCSMSRG